VHDRSLRWNDKKININWPLKKFNISTPKLSDKDASAPFLNEADIFI
jgi:dTDP-4-dehydrorhamnose 3,5-epimerase-like enzyme